MTEKTVTIKNKAGIHCRPSSAIMSAAEKYSSTHDMQALSIRGNSNLRSILDLLALGLQYGDTVTVKVNGPLEAEACETLSELFAREFDFPPLK